jgi:hypothetical protein
MISGKGITNSTYNGASNDKYKWSQSTSDVTLQYNFESKVSAKKVKKNNKQIKVDFNSNKLKITSNDKVHLEGELFGPIITDECTWSLEEGTRLIVILEKKGEMIWKTVLKGDSEIDVTKVDNSKKMNEFDEETQGALRKVVYEQNRKRMGLPTSEEEQQINMLKKAWDAEGSPFKGQPFDPSQFNIPSGQMPFMEPTNQK